MSKFRKYLGKFVVVCFFLQIGLTNGQTKQDSVMRVWPNSFPTYWDSIKTESENSTAFHYYLVSEDIPKKLKFKDMDEIFVDSFNNFSRLLVKNNLGTSFNIPTVPLSHIYILEKKRVIVCLSDYSISPYYILLYSLDDGKLLYKRQYNIWELKLNKVELQDLVRKYPNLRACFEQQPNVIKDRDIFYIELTGCMTHATDRLSSLVDTKKIINDRFFPSATLATCQFIEDKKYKTYNYMFDVTDPLYDLIMIGSLPYLLILNDTHGNKINIPLISICDILREIED